MSDPVRDERLEAGTLEAAVRPVLALDDDVRLAARAHRALTDGEALLRAARAEATALREAARQEGLARGLAQAAAVLQEAESLRREAARAARADVARLAVAAAGKLLGRELRAAPQALAELVEQALAEAAGARRARVLVGPQPEEALEAARARLSARAADLAWVLEVDPELAPGDCVIETDLGRIDARLETQLAALLDALLGEVSR